MDVRVRRRIRRVVWWALLRLPTIALVVVLAAGWVGGSYKPIELTAHFQVQYALAAVVLAGAMAAARSWRWLAVALGCLMLTLTRIAPWYVAPAGGADPAAANLRILTANVHKTPRIDAVERLARESNPDILILLEVSERWLDAIAPIREAYADRIEKPRDDPFGIALYSRRPLFESNVQNLGAAGFPTIETHFLAGSTTVTLLAVHVDSPVGIHGGFPLRNRQLAELGERIARLRRETPGPLILVGDLNVTMWSPYYRRLIAATGLDNGRRGFGIRPSWPAWLPAPLRIPLDHILYCGDLRVTGLRVGPDIGSDHFPTVVDLAVGPPAGVMPEP